MPQFGNNLPFNDIPLLKGITKIAQNAINKLKPDIEKIENLIKPNTLNTNLTDPRLSLVNTNSNINLNQQTQISPGVTQTVLNYGPQVINKEPSNLNLQKIESSPNQLNFQGPRDLPSYAGIANMSLKSWISSYDSKSSPKYEQEIKQLTSTLEGIKGFQRRNSDSFNTDSEREQRGQNQDNKRKYLMVLSEIFAPLFEEQASIQETEIITNILNFKKLGSQSYQDTSEESFNEARLIPPTPDELQMYEKVDLSQVKCLYQLLALPNQFPECIRLFAGEELEIDPYNLKQFFDHRLSVVQEQLLGKNSYLNQTIANFAPLLNSQDFSLIIPLVLLYYPLPLPQLKDNYDFLRGWEKARKKRSKKKKKLLASCEIYYFSRITGRILLRFELTEDNQFNFDIQVVSHNEKIIKALEIGIEEIMFLVNEPPTLSELNILLTREIYNATDTNEQLSIVSSGTLRIEIVLAVYSSLIVLNKLNQDLEPGGIIDIGELI